MTIKCNVGEITISNGQFEWKINIVDELKSTAKDYEICSPKFSSFHSKDKNMTWLLSLLPNGDDESSDGYMAVYLTSFNKHNVTVDYRLSIMTNNGEKIDSHPSLFCRKFELHQGYGISDYVSKFFLLNPINDLIDDDKITIVCSIKENNVCDKITKRNELHLCQQMNKKIFNNKKYSDVAVVSSDGKEFFLHKCVLAEHSSVFEAMFDTDMKEKKENLVKIDDFVSDILEDFFEFFYTGQVWVEYVKRVGSDFLFLAEKYNVKKLKDRCEMILSLDINMDNAIEYFKIADMNNAEKLRSNVVWFIAFNLKKYNEKPSEFSYVIQEPTRLREVIDAHFKLLEKFEKKLR